MKEKDTIIKILFSKIERNTIQLTILEQSNRNIDFFSKRADYRLICSSMPQISRSTFYLRGSSKGSDWVECPLGIRKDSRIRKILTALFDFAAYSLSDIECELMDNSFCLSIVTSSSKKRSLIKPGSVDDIIKLIYDMKISDVSFCLHCETVKTETKQVRYCTNDGNMAIVRLCKSCFKLIDVCEFCETSSNVEERIDTLGKKRKVCARCDLTVKCVCGKSENKKLVKRTVNIGKKGEDVFKIQCQKCLEELKRCLRCGHFFNDESHDKCPCETPSTFENWIMPWNSRAEDEIGIYDNDSRLFGMELEVGVHCSNRKNYEEVFVHTKDIIGRDAITVYDRSIDELDTRAHILNDFRGFEIVTRPMSFKNMKQFIEKLSDNHHELLESWKVQTTGLHIHVSRNSLSKIQIGKILVFINDEKNRNLIHFIARRLNKQYSRLSPKRIIDCYNRDRSAHYEAVNTSKEDTIEFRMFRGSIKKEVVMSYLEFAQATIEFITYTPTKKLFTDNFLEWLKNETHRSQYRVLKKRLKTFDDLNTWEVE